jgi:hypothetical protein
MPLDGRSVLALPAVASYATMAGVSIAVRDERPLRDRGIAVFPSRLQPRQECVRGSLLEEAIDVGGD